VRRADVADFAPMPADDSSLRIRPVTDRRSLRDFIEVPWSIYRDDPCWVPPLRAERKLALSPRQPLALHAEWQTWVAYRGDVPVGRISAQIDRLHLERYADQTGFFGFLEGIDDARVFGALFDAAESWLKERGMRRVRGPFSLNINQEAGLLVEGFDRRPYVMMGHARPYYESRVLEQGYRGAKDLLAYEVDVPYRRSELLERMLERQKERLRVRPFDPARRDAELAILRDIFNDAWSGNWSFVPFTEAEFDDMGRTLLHLLPPGFIQIAEVDGVPSAFMAFIPNLNEVIADLDGRLLPFGWARLLWRLKVKFPKSVRVALMGVRPSFHFTRLGPTLAYAVIKGCLPPALAKGVSYCEMSWILDDNVGMRNIIESVGGFVSKRYRVYDKDLG